MTQFSLNDIKPDASPVDQDKVDLAKLLDKHENGIEIEKMVDELQLTYLEAATAWLEENSIPETQFNKFIPAGIVEKIMSEAIDENLLRPSVSRGEKTNTLDFFL